MHAAWLCFKTIIMCARVKNLRCSVRPLSIVMSHTLQCNHTCALYLNQLSYTHSTAPLITWTGTVLSSNTTRGLSHAQSLSEPLTPQLLYSIFTQIQGTLVPPTILREWAEQTYLTTTDFWTFRKQVQT